MDQCFSHTFIMLIGFFLYFWTDISKEEISVILLEDFNKNTLNGEIVDAGYAVSTGNGLVLSEFENFDLVRKTKQSQD